MPQTSFPPSSTVSFLSAPPLKRTSTLLRELLARDDVVVAPGVFDGLSARTAVAAGFEVLYGTGAGITASRLGMPDLAIATLDDFVAQGGMMASLSPSTPLILDADTGFGGPVQIARTVIRYERAGIAALHLEDQVITKRCGHLLGKELVTQDDFIVRIRAAVAARASIPGCDIVLIARTDAAQGLGMDEAIARLKAAVQAGADVAFLEGVDSRSNVERTVRELAPTPVLLNLVRHSVTPNFTIQECKDMGVKLAILPGVALQPVVAAMIKVYKDLRSNGVEETFAQGTGDGSGELGNGNKTDRMAPRDLFKLLGRSDPEFSLLTFRLIIHLHFAAYGATGLDEAVKIDQVAGGKAFSNGV